MATAKTANAIPRIPNRINAHCLDVVHLESPEERVKFLNRIVIQFTSATTCLLPCRLGTQFVGTMFVQPGCSLIAKKLGHADCSPRASRPLYPSSPSFSVEFPPKHNGNPEKTTKTDTPPASAENWIEYQLPQDPLKINRGTGCQGVFCCCIASFLRPESATAKGQQKNVGTPYISPATSQRPSGTRILPDKRQPLLPAK